MTKESARTDGKGRISRRAFVGGVSAGAVAAGGAAALVGTSGGSHAPTTVPVGRGQAGQNPLNFGRVFSGLPSFAEPTDDVIAALRELGRPGGIMDAKDNLAVGPVQLIVDPNQSTVNRDNPTQFAGTTFIGQFLDHDVTFDSTSQLGVPTEPQRTRNSRVPTLDLDSVYGGGPSVSRQLYDRRDRAKLRIESGGLFEDVPRNPDGSAIIADGRNDENLVISGLQAAFIIFHNKMVDLVRSERRVPNTRDVNAVFRAAQNQTRWHYQTMILTQFLPWILGQPMTDDILTNGRRFYRASPGRAFMPVEFQTGCYRMGHSQVRPSYRVNFTGQPAGKPNSPEFFGFIFDPSQEGIPDSEDMRGGSRAPRRYIGWPTFFDFGDGLFRRNKAVDTVISTALFQLPLFAIASGDPPTSLPERNLLRHLTWELPSGQTMAQQMGANVLTAADLATTGIGDIRESFLTSTPMWFYILHEASLQHNGDCLGDCGGRLVGEVIIGLMQLDRTSVFSQANFQPLIPVRESGKVLIQDILDFAGVSGRR
jgi:hypothetical protein